MNLIEINEYNGIFFRDLIVLDINMQCIELKLFDFVMYCCIVMSIIYKVFELD